MTQKTADNQTSSNLLTDLLQNLQLAWRLMTDTRVPVMNKVLVPALGLLYFILPIDLLPDVVPVLGQLDDIAVVLLLVRLFIMLAPPDVVAGYRASAKANAGGHAAAGAQDQPTGRNGADAAKAAPDDVVDAQYRVVRDA